MKVRILVCDTERARFFESPGLLKILHPVDEIVHEPDPYVDLTPRQQSSSHTSNGIHGAKPSRSDPAENERNRFARRVAEHLNQDYAKKHFDRLIVAAPPVMLGKLRDELDLPVLRTITKTVDKDLMHFTPAQLANTLDAD